MSNEFVHIGMGTIIQKTRVIFITAPGSTTANRYIEIAKKTNKYHNATLGKRYRSIIVMDDGTVIMSTISAKTLMRRLNGIDPAAEEDDPDDVAEEAEIPDGDGE